MVFGLWTIDVYTCGSVVCVNVYAIRRFNAHNMYAPIFYLFLVCDGIGDELIK